MDQVVIKKGKSIVYFKPEIELKRTKDKFIEIWIESPIFKSLRGREKMLGEIYAGMKKKYGKKIPKEDD